MVIWHPSGTIWHPLEAPGIIWLCTCICTQISAQNRFVFTVCIGCDSTVFGIKRNLPNEKSCVVLCLLRFSCQYNDWDDYWLLWVFPLYLSRVFITVTTVNLFVQQSCFTGGHFCRPNSTPIDSSFHSTMIVGKGSHEFCLSTSSDIL